MLALAASLAWDRLAGFVSYAQEQDILGEYPWWDTRSAPPQPDWFVALELAQDIGESIFTLHELPKQEPFLSLVRDWAYWRRQALSLADSLRASAPKD